MPRSVRIHRSAVVAVGCLGGASLLVGALLGAPALATASTSSVAASSTASASFSTFNPTEHDITTLPPGGSTPACAPASLPSPANRWSVGEVDTAYDFEDAEGLGGWSGRGSSTWSVTDEAATSGTHSALIDGFTTDDMVGFPTALPHAGWYKVTLMMRLKTPGAGVTVTLRPRTSDPARSVAGSASVTDRGWTQVIAYLQPDPSSSPYCSGASSATPAHTAVDLQIGPALCGPAATGPISFWLDDVKVTTLDSSIDGTASPIPVPLPPTLPPLTCPPPSPTTPTSGGTAGGTCRPEYTVVTTWPGGYLANVTIRNLTSTAAPRWHLAWTFPDDQRVVSLWGDGGWSQTGRGVSVTSPTWAPLPAGGTVSVGFVTSTSGTGAPRAPWNLTVDLDGRTCGVLA